MVIFHSYVKLPEGIWYTVYPIFHVMAIRMVISDENHPLELGIFGEPIFRHKYL